MSWDENHRNAERSEVQKKVEFFVDADIIQAESVDLSEGGIRMCTNRPIEIRMRMYHEDGGFDERVAQLVWARRGEQGMEYGYEFQPDPEEQG